MGITNSFKTNLIIFLTLVFISYVVDITRNKCDKLCFAAKVNNLLHHFLSTYLYFGSIVIGYHEFHILYVLMGSVLWYIFDGYCVMTLQYNEMCNFDKEQTHHELVYMLSNEGKYYSLLTIVKAVFIYDILYLIRKYYF